MAWDDDDDNNDFDFGDLSPEEEREIEREMREREKKLKNHPLNKKAHEILSIVYTLVETMPDEDKERMGSILMESAMMIPAKIAGAIGSDSWLICMQNASIIRYHASQLLIQNHSLREFTKTDPDYIKLLRREMEEFQKLFREWAAGFDLMEREDYEDEWGLFIRK